MPAAFAVQASASAWNDAARDSAKSMPVAVDKIEGISQSSVATQPAGGGVKPHNHGEFHKQGPATSDMLPAPTGAGKPSHDHGRMHKQQ